jgi:hypothetical protein
MGFKIVRSGNWKAVYDHARSQIDSWELEKNDTANTREKVLKIQRSVHDVLQAGTGGPDQPSYKRWGWWITGRPLLAFSHT